MWSFFRNQLSQFSVKQSIIQSIPHFIWVVLGQSEKTTRAKIIKMRLFTKAQYVFDFCQIKSTYSEFSRRKLSIGTNIVHNFSIYFWAIFCSKWRPLRQKIIINQKILNSIAKNGYFNIIFMKTPLLGSSLKVYISYILHISLENGSIS